jgi:hypothetical protein
MRWLWFGRISDYSNGMEFDQLIVRFFGTEDIDSLSAEQLLAGLDRLRLQFGLEKDSGRRFGLWCLLYMLGAAPDLDVAFEDEADREAARDFMDMADREIEEDE